MVNVFGAASSTAKDESKNTSFIQSTKDYYSKNSHMVSIQHKTNCVGAICHMVHWCLSRS